MKPREKPKLPKYLSFPVGFDAVSAAFATVPFVDEIILSFDNGFGASQVQARDVIESNEPHFVLRGEFYRWDKRLGVAVAGERLHQGAWDVYVFPVRRDLKPIARKTILQDGLPRLVEWFCTERPESWYWGRKRCNVIFDPSEGTVRTEIDDLHY